MKCGYSLGAVSGTNYANTNKTFYQIIFNTYFLFTHSKPMHEGHPE